MRYRGWEKLTNRKSKFGNVKKEKLGQVFDSGHEAKFYPELLLMEAAGKIFQLELQPKYRIEVAGKYICTYKGDYKFSDERGKEICFDPKGAKTPVYRLKIKLAKALFPNVEFTEEYLILK